MIALLQFGRKQPVKHPYLAPLNFLSIVQTEAVNRRTATLPLSIGNVTMPSITLFSCPNLDNKNAAMIYQQITQIKSFQSAQSLFFPLQGSSRLAMTQYGRDRAWPFAEGGGGTIAIFTILLATAVFLWVQFTSWATGLFLLLAAFFWLLILYFFRDPNRQINAKPGLVLGPGDGEVVEISTMTEERFLQAETIRLSMFLDITDVHVQRVPLAGKVILVAHKPGRFLQAFKPEASEVNEFIAMVTESEGYGRILTKQIAGILARRCLNYLKPGDVVQTGQRFGLIRFSSRVDLFLPPTAHMLVKVGDKVIGGITPIAQLQESHE